MPFLLEKSDFFIAKEGKNVLRILPSWRGDNQEFYLEVPTHYNINAQTRALICRRMIRQPCPVCLFIEDLYKTKSHFNVEQAARMAPVNRLMLNVLPQQSRDVKVWSIGERMLHDILSYVVDAGYGDLSDPVKGRDLVLYRTGDGKNTQYTLNVAPLPSTVRLKDWERKLFDLDQFFHPPSAIEMRDILRG